MTTEDATAPPCEHAWNRREWMHEAYRCIHCGVKMKDAESATPAPVEVADMVRDLLLIQTSNAHIMKVVQSAASALHKLAAEKAEADARIERQRILLHAALDANTPLVARAEAAERALREVAIYEYRADRDGPGGMACRLCKAVWNAYGNDSPREGRHKDGCAARAPKDA